MSPSWQQVRHAGKCRQRQIAKVFRNDHRYTGQTIKSGLSTAIHAKGDAGVWCFWRLVFRR